MMSHTTSGTRKDKRKKRYHVRTVAFYSLSTEYPYLPAINSYVENLLEQALNEALPAASRALTCPDLASSLSSTEAHNSVSSLDPYLQRQSSMDHLEVNFRDWYAQYRRRSSNLSDLSSRRSSCDMASRRSSACSAKGYSSEFSSEFEEYFDNFQLQEPRYKYHTIKEESGSTAVMEFAMSLAASLLQQGTKEAAVLCPSPHSFQDCPPSDNEFERPTPVRVLAVPADEDIVEPTRVDVDSVQLYVSDLIESIWPFGNDSIANEVVQELQVQIIDGCKRKKTDKEIENIVVNYSNIGDDMDNCEEEEADTADSDTDSRDTQYSIVEVDDEILLAVADRIVTVAFQEALLECKYSLNMTKHPICHSFSESSQSDHSMDAKDQVDSSVLDISSQSGTGFSSDSKHLEPAMRIAEKVVSGIFSKKESPQTSLRSGNTVCNEAMGVRNGGHSYQGDCDTDLKVVIDTVPSSHSNLNSNSLPQRQLDMYDRIADRLLHGSFTSGIRNSSASQCNVNNPPNSSASSTLTCDYKHYSSQHSSSPDTSVSHTDKVFSMPLVKVSSSDEPSGAAVSPQSSPREVCLKTKHSNDRSEKGSSAKAYSQQICKTKTGSDSLKTKNKNVSTTVPVKSVESGSPQKVSVPKSPGKNVNSSKLFGASSSAINKLSSSSPDTSSSDSSLLLGAVAVSHASGSHRESDPSRLTSQSKMKPKPSYPFVIGNKKNYDQFANSLTRDLLTNAFLQVQEHHEFASYPRRSSEPMQISNGAALQRLEHSAQTMNGQRSQKSKTDEDISSFDWEWSQQFTPRTSSGFRDPVLSR